jgi:hypothetical protein
LSQWNPSEWKTAPETPGMYIFIDAATKNSKKLIVVY